MTKGESMGNENSQMSGLEFEERAVEVTDHWTLYSAVLKSLGAETRLSIFQGEPVVQGQLWLNKTPLEKAAKNLMLHRHPCILKYVSSWRKGSAYYLAVENMKPLELSLPVQTNIQICLGLRNIVRALVFLHEQAHSYHNNVCISSIFVTENGSWKLGGLEYLVRTADISQEFLLKSKTHRYSKSIDPDEVKNNGKGGDQYSFAVLVSEVLKTSKDDDFIGISEFKTYCCTQLKHSNPDMRPTLSALLLHPFFNHEFITIHSFLSELPLKTKDEKTDFFTKLQQKLKLFNEGETASHLGELLISRMVLLDVTAQNKFLPYLFKPITEENPDGLFSEFIFQKVIGPKLLRVFCVRDLQIRLILLQYFSYYVHLFSKPDLTNHILPELLVGIKDTNDELVAVTLRSLAELVPILGSATVVGGNRRKLFTDGRPKEQFSNKVRNTAFGKSKTHTEVQLSTPIRNDLNNENNIVSSESTYALTERLSPDGGEDVNISISLQNKHNEEWSDWECDSNNLNETNEVTELPNLLTNSLYNHSTRETNIKQPLKYDDITDLDIKVQKSTKDIENEIDFFHDMEPIIQKSNIFIVEGNNTDLSENNKDIIANKFEITSTNMPDGNDGWDDNLNDWSE